MKKVEKKALAALLEERFELVEKHHEEYMVVFKFDNKFESFIFGAYGFKTKTEELIEELFKGKNDAEVRALINNARDYFKAVGNVKIKAYYPAPQDMDSTSSREDLLMLCTRNFSFD